MNRKTTLRLIYNTLFSYLSHFISQLSTFILLPIIVAKIGKPNFGLYTLALSIPALLAFLDFGMRPALVKLLAPLQPEKDWLEINQIVTSAFVVRIVSGAVISLVILLLALNIQAVFKIENEQLKTAQRLFLIISLFSFLNWVLATFRPIIFAYQRFEMETLSVIASSVAGFSMALLFLECFGNIESVAIGLLGGHFLGHFLYLFSGFRLLPRLCIKPRYLSRDVQKKVYSFGGKLFVVAFCGSILYQFDKILLGHFRGPSDIAEYGIADTLHLIPRTVHGLSVSALTPTISTLESAGRWEEIHGLIIVASRLVLGLVNPIAIYLIVFAEPFIFWYVGKEFQVSILASQIFVAYWLFNSNTGVIGSALTGTGLVNFLVYYTSVILVVKVTLSLLLIPSWGVVGAVSATTVIYVCSFGFYLKRGLDNLSMSMALYFKKVFLRHVVAIISVFGISIYLKLNYVEPTFFSLLSSALVVFVSYQLLFLFFGMNKQERSTMVSFLRKKRVPCKLQS